MNAITQVKPPATLSVDMLVEKYVALRDKRDEVRKEHLEIEARFKAGLDFLADKILDVLDATGAEHTATKHGTAMRVLKTSATVLDWPMTLQYIRDEEAWDLLEARVSKLAVEAIIKETARPIPGVKVSQIFSISVRRPSKRAP